MCAMRQNMAEEYCSVIIQEVGWSCCSHSGSSVLEFGFQLDLYINV